MADDYEHLAEKTDLSLWRTPAIRPKRRSSELAFRQVATPNDRPLLVQLVNGGKIAGGESPCGERHLRARTGLPLEALKMSRGEPGDRNCVSRHWRGDGNPCRTEPSGELRAAGGVGNAGPTREL